jgi:hypothetical protein
MISVVNGYVCTSSCEATSARQGKDPNVPPGSPPGASSKNGKTSAFAGQPATLLDGSLKDSGGTNAVTATSNVQPARLDRLV